MIENFGLVNTKASFVKIGDLFGRLKVVAIGQVANTYRYYAICQCECGSPLKRVRSDGLVNGSVLSCGCARLDSVVTHGLTKTAHYDRWKNMMDRCYNESCRAYKNYGGRGIKVCDGWHDVSVYISQLPSGYWHGAHLDRIDNDGMYEPINVKWSTPKENSSNRRSARLLTVKGVTKSQSEWAKESGIPDSVIHKRLNRLGWLIDDAISTPVASVESVVKIASGVRWAGHKRQDKAAPKTGRRLRLVAYKGKEMTIAQLSELCGVGVKKLHKRLFEYGWPVSRATLK